MTTTTLTVEVAGEVLAALLFLLYSHYDINKLKNKGNVEAIIFSLFNSGKV
ncbi:hypothetical protein J2Z23_004412 [Lederbergia galactosidilyticus]|uniref:hypothetical protein n=1 Tax=Lederbergia galactosidilytica TaxID=217031 RepID=UPI000A46B924|nr:hypothetical protein [Lederbergia galactosidilytica]MBP1917407.1 hypothetical protein [Lederbergia galactosidilytica]